MFAGKYEDLAAVRSFPTKDVWKTHARSQSDAKRFTYVYVYFFVFTIKINKYIGLNK